MLKTTVFEQLKQAMKEKDVLSKGVLTLLKSALDMAEKEKGSALTEEEEVAIVNREIKQTNQALEGAEKAQREDLIEQENKKLILLKSFLPKQLSEEEVKTLLTEAGVVQGMNMGDAMKIAKPLLAGKTDGATMSKAVKSLIQ
ncbi:GatB/YqeY domain-containing protein [Sporosarcina koreensis]|uniref:GatB/YqeY domain-containing protein n=1 Tax=Bacillales TaxID=1385 RepID=UPI000752CC20|nr:GatB/YqeY domain-containing protein [Sporosarcina koreensis]